MSDIDTNIDWDSAIKDAVEGTQPIPAGQYTVKAVEAEATRAQSSGSPMIKVTLEVVGGPHSGRWVWTNLVLKPGSPPSAKMFAVKCMAFGLTPEWLAANRPSLGQVAEVIKGRTVSAEVVQREYNGKPTNDVKSLKAATGTPGIPSAPAPGPAPAPAVAAPAPAAAVATAPVPNVDAAVAAVAPAPAPVAPAPAPAPVAEAAPAPVVEAAPAPAPEAAVIPDEDPLPPTVAEAQAEEAAEVAAAATEDDIFDEDEPF